MNSFMLYIHTFFGILIYMDDMDGKCNCYKFIILNIVLGESLFKITLEFLVFN